MRNVKVFLVVLTVLCAPHASRAQDAELAAKVDRVVASVAARSSAPGPGCTIGVSSDGRTVERAFGMADIELGIPLTPQSILESGSVAKQFTSASIVLLALAGKLALDDPVKKYIPELPDYGAPLTIRHLLNHTSGSRDWGAGRERTGDGRGARRRAQALARDGSTQQR